MTTRPTAAEWEALVDRLNSEPREWADMDYTEEDYDRDLAVHDRYAWTHRNRTLTADQLQQRHGILTEWTARHPSDTAAAAELADVDAAIRYAECVAAREELAAARAAGQPPGVCDYLQRRYIAVLERNYGSAS